MYSIYLAVPAIHHTGGIGGICEIKVTIKNQLIAFPHNLSLHWSTLSLASPLFLKKYSVMERILFIYLFIYFTDNTLNEIACLSHIKFFKEREID